MFNIREDPYAFFKSAWKTQSFHIPGTSHCRNSTVYRVNFSQEVFGGLFWQFWRTTLMHHNVFVKHSMLCSNLILLDSIWLDNVANIFPWSSCNVFRWVVRIRLFKEIFEKFFLERYFTRRVFYYWSIGNPKIFIGPYEKKYFSENHVVAKE